MSALESRVIYKFKSNFSILVRSKMKVKAGVKNLRTYSQALNTMVKDNWQVTNL